MNYPGDFSHQVMVVGVKILAHVKGSSALGATGHCKVQISSSQVLQRQQISEGRMNEMNHYEFERRSRPTKNIAYLEPGWDDAEHNNHVED